MVTCFHVFLFFFDLCVSWQLRCFFFPKDANISVVTSQIYANEAVEADRSLPSESRDHLIHH